MLCGSWGLCLRSWPGTVFCWEFLLLCFVIGSRGPLLSALVNPRQIPQTRRPLVPHSAQRVLLFACTFVPLTRRRFSYRRWPATDSPKPTHHVLFCMFRVCLQCIGHFTCKKRIIKMTMAAFQLEFSRFCPVGIWGVPCRHRRRASQLNVRARW